ncbi:hypothetical protein LX15_003770 [Streptoalloteichus tenebrarius]|uniref:Uncharacterized protein n=3 Tax=Streptoalloteichus tenebrarius (strain ATCC 17920 / DSM 40477 / JCM 4838 / CBS 697.72 / NBRC 16177 / NCIMB 11028 / NRRL B-12390 / A12253. 1 / ISP 5477) TaxID=1933 RepID=A0ABT1HX30_STRSD|nr:hypothetical protein [Streptoalloteichus tenebrarius]
MTGRRHRVGILLGALLTLALVASALLEAPASLHSGQSVRTRGSPDPSGSPGTDQAGARPSAGSPWLSAMAPLGPESVLSVRTPGSHVPRGTWGTGTAGSAPSALSMPSMPSMPSMDAIASLLTLEPPLASVPAPPWTAAESPTDMSAAGAASAPPVPAPSARPSPQGPSPPAPYGPSPEPSRPDVAAAARAAAPTARLGLLVVDRVGGRTVAELEPDRQFASQSLVKLLMAMDWLLTHGPPDEERRARLVRMLGVSDDGVADELWSTNGGPDIVRRMSERVGLRGTTPPADPSMWGDTRTTAADMAALYRYLLERAPREHRDLVLDGLRAFSPTAADGFRQAFGIPAVAQGRPWIGKQGWACCLPGYALHTTGLVGADERFVVVLLSEHPTALGWSAAVTAVNAATAALAPALTPS